MTVKYNKIELHSAFQKGQLNDHQFTDLPNFSEDQVKLLTTFMGKVVNEEPLLGKNKPSWLNDDHEKIPDTDAYEDGNYWHYHCGPYTENKHVNRMTFNLNFNADGLTSDAVIHYQKEADGTVLIVGFSKTHVPFPKSDEPHENPLFCTGSEEE